MISEKGLCKILKSAYKRGGYSVIPVRKTVEEAAKTTWRRNEIILNGATWAVGAWRRNCRRRWPSRSWRTRDTCRWTP